MRRSQVALVSIAVLFVLLAAFGPQLAGSIQAGFPVNARTGNTNTYATSTGSLTSGHCVSIDASGNYIDNGSACGSAGSGTVASGAAFQMGQYQASGTTISLVSIPNCPSASGALNFNSGTGVFTCNAQGPTTNQNIRTIGASFGSFQSGATALSAAATSCVPVYFAGTIQAVHLIGNVSGSVTVDVQTVLHSGWTGTAAVSSITAADIPALSSATAYTDTTLTGWTTSLAANTDVCFVLTSPTTVSGVSITLKVAAN